MLIMKNKDIKDRYCEEFGYGYFNKYNEGDYSKWLESQLIKSEAKCDIEALSKNLSSIIYEKANELNYDDFVTWLKNKT